MTMLGKFRNAVKKDVGNTSTTIYTAPAAGSYLIQCDIACTSNSGVQVSVSVEDASQGVEVFLVKNAPVPVGSSIQVIDGQKIVLEEADKLKVVCETTGKAVDVVVSLVENVNLEPTY